MNYSLVTCSAASFTVAHFSSEFDATSAFDRACDNAATQVAALYGPIGVINAYAKHARNGEHLSSKPHCKICDAYHPPSECPLGTIIRGKSIDGLVYYVVSADEKTQWWSWRASEATRMSRHDAEIWIDRIKQKQRDQEPDEMIGRLTIVPVYPV